jgi:hypothetical protein
VLPRLSVAVPACWLIAGGATKLLLATPGDLPGLVREATPFGLETTFRLAVGVELAVGLAALLRPRAFAPLVGLLLVGFGAVLGAQVAEGATSCGCFGGRLHVPPLLMAGLDAGMLALLLAGRPLRLPRGTGVPLPIALVLAAAAAAAPWLFTPAGAGGLPR